MGTKEKHSLEFVEMLERKVGPQPKNERQPIITPARVHMERLTYKQAKRLQRIMGGEVKERYNGLGDLVWKVTGKRNIDRVLSLLISSERGRQYFEEHCPEAGSDRWREYNLADN